MIISVSKIAECFNFHGISRSYRPRAPCVILTSLAILWTTPCKPSRSRPHFISPLVVPPPLAGASVSNCASIHSAVDESKSAFMTLCIGTAFKSSGRLENKLPAFGAGGEAILLGIYLSVCVHVYIGTTSTLPRKMTSCAAGLCFHCLVVTD